MNIKIKKILIIVFFLLISLSVIHFNQIQPAPNLDPSWAYSLSASIDYNYQFGKDIIFTYGPYFNLMVGFNQPKVYMINLFLGFVISVFYTITILSMIDKKKLSNWIYIFLIPLFGLNNLTSIFLIVPLISFFKIIRDINII
jgi:hypothetical protein